MPSAALFTCSYGMLRAELEARGVDVKDGYWGYPVMIIQDPDGNELYFNYPSTS